MWLIWASWGHTGQLLLRMLRAASACWVGARQLCRVISVSRLHRGSWCGLRHRNQQFQRHLSFQTLKAFFKEDENGGFENKHYWMNFGKLLVTRRPVGSEVFQGLRFQPAAFCLEMQPWCGEGGEFKAKTERPRSIKLRAEIRVDVTKTQSERKSILGKKNSIFKRPWENDRLGHIWENEWWLVWHMSKRDS